jgi:hypothetical protein
MWAEAAKDERATQIRSAGLRDHGSTTAEGRAGCAAYVIEKAESFDVAPVPDLSRWLEAPAETIVRAESAVPVASSQTPVADVLSDGLNEVLDVAAEVEASRFKSRFKALDAPKEAPMRDVMVEGGVWPDRASGMLLGPDKSGKTTYALEEMLCLAGGWPVFGQFAVPKARRVLYVSEEDTPERLIRRVYDLIIQHEPQNKPSVVYERLKRGALHILVGNHLRFDAAEDVAELERLVREYEFEVVYLDALGKLSKQQVSRDDDAGRLVEQFARLEQAGAVLRVVHHTSKARTKGGWTPDTMTVRDGAGHHALADWCRASLLFSRRKPVIVQPRPALVTEVPSLIRFEGSDGAPVKVGQMIQRHAETYDARSRLLDSHLTSLTFAEAEEASRLDLALLAKVVSILPPGGQAPLTTAEVADKTGLGRTPAGKNKARRYLDAAVAAGKAVVAAQVARGAVLWRAA